MSGSRHLTRLFGSTLFLAALGMGWPMGCTSGGLVGGECRFGLIECNGKCVNIGSDSSNCGSCGNVCSEGRTCMSGNCLLMSGTGSGGADSSMPGSDEAGVGGVGGLDGLGGGGSSNDGGSAGGILVPDGGATAAGGAIDSGLDAGLGPDSGSAGGGVGGSGNAGSGNTGGGSGGSPDASVVLCEAPFNSANNCGDCSTRCQGATPFCAPTDGGYGCVNSCADGLIPCGDVCADLDNDASNCGQCGRICPSGLCAGGECIGDTAGNLVLMCSSFDLVSENAPQTRILGNAVFVGINNPVRILMYEQYATPTAKAGVRQTLEWAKGTRTYELTLATTPETIVDDLTRDNFEVLLFLDQAEAPAGALAPLGTLLADPIANFTEEGGSAVILASASGTLEMDEFINAGNMLDNLTGLQPYSFETVYNRAPADSVGKDVLSPFLSLLFSCTFTTTDTPDVDTAFVVTNASPTSGDVGDPMVIHHVLAR